jgi:hypothetical protein
MKQITLIILSMFFTFISFSQVLLTLINNSPTPGDSNLYVKIPFIVPGDAGPDKVWDFSGIGMTGEKMVSKISSASSDKEKGDIDFNVILNEQGSAYYYQLTGDSFMEVGQLTKDWTVTYSDPVIRMIYPFAYGDHFTDNFAGVATIKNVKRAEFNGVYSVTADAYGTLILPDHSYTDVLRLRTESNGLEINPCHSVEVKVIHYLWYALGHRYPLMNVSISERRTSGKEAEITRSTLIFSGSNSAGPNGKGQSQDGINPEDNPVVVVYPNPFGDKLNYYYFLRKSVPVFLTLTDVTGRTSALLMKQQMQSEGLHSTSIESDDFNLTPGIYYLRFVFDKQVIVRKIIKM